MTLAGSERFDVATVRHANPIDVVVAASGVELTQRGHGFMGCCPFHDDSTASLSVGGVPDRFHCFGCGASGDVIEYVVRFSGLSFVEAVQALESGTAFHGVQPAPCVRSTGRLERPSWRPQLSVPTPSTCSRGSSSPPLLTPASRRPTCLQHAASTLGLCASPPGASRSLATPSPTGAT